MWLEMRIPKIGILKVNIFYYDCTRQLNLPNMKSFLISFFQVVSLWCHSKTEKRTKCTKIYKKKKKQQEFCHHFRKEHTHACNYCINERPGTITDVLLQ